MGLFGYKKTEGEIKREKEQIKREEEKILENKQFFVQIGHIHQGLGIWGLWSTLNNGKTKFNSTSVKIYDDRLFFERNKVVIYFSQIKEVFEVNNDEAVIILNNDDGIPLKTDYYGKSGVLILKAIVNVINYLIQNNNSNDNNEDSNVSSDDNLDKLIKLGEMYKDGLLTDGEFALMKQKLIAGENEDTMQPKTSDNSCENCGAEISSEDAFCSECGNKIQ